MNEDAAAEAELGTVLYFFEKNRAKIAEESYRNKFFDADQNTYEVAVDFQYSRKRGPSKGLRLCRSVSGEIASGSNEHRCSDQWRDRPARAQAVVIGLAVDTDPDSATVTEGSATP